jgi:hypothetical protein
VFAFFPSANTWQTIPPRRQLRLSPSSVSVAYFFAVRHEKMHDKWDCRAPRQKAFDNGLFAAQGEKRTTNPFQCVF